MEKEYLRKENDKLIQIIESISKLKTGFVGTFLLCALRKNLNAIRSSHFELGALSFTYNILIFISISNEKRNSIHVRLYRP